MLRVPSSEFLLWCCRQRELSLQAQRDKWLEHEPSHYYAAQIVAEIRSIFSNKRIATSDCLIPFTIEEAQPAPPPEEQVNMDPSQSVSKSIWMGILGLG